MLFFPYYIECFFKKINLLNMSNLNNAVDLMLVLSKVLIEVLFSLSFILLYFIVVLAIKTKVAFNC